MDIKGIGNELSNAYSAISESKETESEFQKIFEQATKNQNDEELKEACQGFEAYFVRQLFKEMRQTIPKGGLFEDSNEKDIYEDMLDEEYSNVLSKKSGFGIADTLYKQLSSQIKPSSSEKSETEEE